MSNLDLFGGPPGDHPPERPPREPRVYQVRELNLEAGRLLEQRFPIVRVEGEISGWTRHRGSGHCYFALKDDRAELRCVLFQSQAARLSFEPSDGLRVVATGRVTIYPDRGQYQLRALELAPAGLGALMQALQELKGRLTREGLFEETRKRPLPRVPGTVGVVTSASGAAIRDVVRVLRSRWPAIEIVLAPVSVQGPGSAADIVHGIHKQAWWDRADVLIVGRGGGSLEDLWAFNEEIVVRAVAASPIPIISAVGHESDVTLADLAADVRAATPSRAAELAVPDAVEIRRLLHDQGSRLRHGTRQALTSRRDRLRRLAMSHGLHRPRTVVEHALQRVDDLGHRFAIASGRALDDRRAGVRSVGIRLRGAALGRSRMARAELGRLWLALRAPARRFPERHRHRVGALEGKLDALDPTQVLGRGYALVAGPDGVLIRDGATLRPGERVRMRFHRGGAEGTVNTAWADDPGPDSVETA